MINNNEKMIIKYNGAGTFVVSPQQDDLVKQILVPGKSF